MSDERVSRWMGLLGLLTVIVVFVGFGPLSGKTPGENASGASIAAFYNAHMARSWASIYVVGLGLALPLLFVSKLRTVLRNTSGGQTFWPNVAFAAGIILVAGMAVAGIFQVVVILAAHNQELAIAKVANFVNSNDELGFLFGMVLLTLATGASILLNRSTNPLPKRLGWWSVLVGVVGCLGPISFFALLFGLPIWLIATGFVIGTKARRATTVAVTSPVDSGNGGRPDHYGEAVSPESGSIMSTY